jgi:hypothetical protein
MASQVEQARDALSKGRKEKIDVEDLNVYVDEGDKQKFLVEVDTIVGGGTITATASTSLSGTVRKKVLNLKTLGNGDWPSLDGYNSLHIPVSTTVPSLGADKYTVRFELKDFRGELADVKERTFLIRKT